MGKAFLAVAMILWLSPACAVSQPESPREVPNLPKATRIADDAAARQSIPLPFSLLVPEGIRLGYDMRSYLASPEFGTFESSVPSGEAFDEIYFEALEMAHGDISTALLAAAFGSFEHEFLPLAFFGAEIDMPLTSESHARFLLRLSHLPTHLYHTAQDDRDKIQHFYASAWLKSVLGMDWLVRLAGEAVEAGETLFTVGGFRDPRDIHANDDGLRFEMQAEHDPGTIVPSRHPPSYAMEPSASLTPNP